MTDRRAVVIDNGSGFLKAGFAGSKEPAAIFPTVVGKKKPNCRRASLADHYAGEDAMTQRSNVTLRHPLERGVVNQWAEMEMVWDHAYQRLRANPTQQPVLVTESVLNPAANRRRTVETLLETYRAPAVMVADTPSLCLYAQDWDTGLVLECGYSATYAVPIINGEVVHSAVTLLQLGGNDLTVFLLRLVESRGYFFPPAKREMFAEVKEKLCYVAMDYATEEQAVTEFAGKPQSSGIKQSYNLAGETITLETERSQCPESLFQPNWLRVDALGVHQLIHNAIDKCPRDSHAELYSNILVTGGCTCFPGFLERLEVEVKKLCPDESLVNIHAPDNRKTLAWRGGSELCASKNAQDKWITSAEYEEEGENIIKRKRTILKNGEQGRSENTHFDLQDIPEGDTTPRQFTATDMKTSPREAGNYTPRNAMYRDRNVLRSHTTTPTLYSNASSTTPGLPKSTTPGLPKSTTPSGLRGGKLSRGGQSTPAGAGSQRGSSMSRNSPNSVLSVHKLANEARPTSPGVFERSAFTPTLPKTPEMSDAEIDDLGPLKSSAKSRHKKDGDVDFASFRKLSLFDNLLDEVSLFKAAGGKLDSEAGDDDEDDAMSWISRTTHDSSILDKMKEDQLLPGRGASGLRRGESINVDMLKKPDSSKTPGVRPAKNGSTERNASSIDTASVLHVQKIPLAVPAIEITTCVTPHGSASSRAESEPAVVASEPTPRKITFKFK